MDTRDVAVRVAMKLFDERDVRELVLRRMQSVVQSGAIDTSSEKVLVSKVLLSEALQLEIVLRRLQNRGLEALKKY